MKYTRYSQPIVTKCAADDDRRRGGRLRCEGTRSSLGEVVDLSGSGMRVVRRGGPIARIGDEFGITLQWADVKLLVQVRLRRLEKVGFRKYAYGLEFLDPDPDTRAEIARIGRLAADKYTLVGRS